MAIFAYVGTPGSGKSYEVVARVIIPAIRDGRRVVTNIVGVDNDKIRDYCAKTFKPDESSLGEVICVNDAQVMDDEFFPYKGSIDTFCKNGDLICVDEAWRIWESDKAIPVHHKSFISEHRHFTDELTGKCCDLVVINQDVAGFPRLLKSRIESTFRMSKHLSLGLNSRYRVDVFQGAKLFKSSRTTFYQRKYDKAIFPLYQSYDTKNGTENTVDKRQNVLSGTAIKVKIILCVLFMFGGAWYLYDILTTGFGKKKTSEFTTTTQPQITTADQAEQPTVTPREPALSTEWRISGQFKRHDGRYVILSDSAGRVRIVSAEGFESEGLKLSGVVDDSSVTVFSGSTNK